jgi:hypothetical protein
MMAAPVLGASCSKIWNCNMFPSPPLGEFAGIYIAKPELILPAYLLVFFLCSAGPGVTQQKWF